MKTIEAFQAKLRLIEHLGAVGVPKELVVAAKAKLGADLCDALSGDLGKLLRDGFDRDSARLEKLDFQDGDRVSCPTGNTTVSGTIESRGDDDFVVVSNGKRFAAMRSNITSVDLARIRELSEACKAFLP